MLKNLPANANSITPLEGRGVRTVSVLDGRRSTIKLNVNSALILKIIRVKNMTDQDIINQAYQATLNKLFAVFFDAYAIAATPADKAQAEQRFQNGVIFARAARDKAITLL